MEVKTTEQISSEYNRQFWGECKIHGKSCVRCGLIDEMKKTLWLKKDEVIKAIDSWYKEHGDVIEKKDFEALKEALK